jgi:hypothetical protein
MTPEDDAKAVEGLLSDLSVADERMLLRPAVVVFGVGFENAVEAVLEARIAAGTLSKDVLRERAWGRIARLRDEVIVVFPNPKNEAHSAALRALDYADQLRQRRNDAAHTRPRFGFDHRA